MPRLSLKRIIMLALMVFLLVHCGWVLRRLAGLYIFVYDASEPFRDSPPLLQYLVALGLVVLVWIVVKRLFYKVKFYMRKRG